MQKEEIVQHVVWAVKELGYKMVVLQSGEDTAYGEETLCDIAKEIRRQCSVILFFSFGDRNEEFYASLKRAGASGVLYRFETTDQQLFNNLRPGTSFATRAEHLRFLKKMGYLIATGFMVGLPGQSLRSIANDIAALGEFGANMISIGPFIPSPLTPLANEKPGDASLALNAIAVSRIIYKRTRIPVTTAFETLDACGRQQALCGGANSLMVNITPRKYSAAYAIYPGRLGSGEEIAKLTQEAIKCVESMGRRVCRGYAKDLLPKFSAPACV